MKIRIEEREETRDSTPLVVGGIYRRDNYKYLLVKLGRVGMTRYKGKVYQGKEAFGFVCFDGDETTVFCDDRDRIEEHLSQFTYIGKLVIEDA